MKIACAIWIMITFTVLVIKLFTYSFYLADDPTTGIALRFYPALTSHQLLQPSDYILFQDENSFLGEEVYNALTSWGWLLLLAGVPVFIFLLI